MAEEHASKARPRGTRGPSAWLDAFLLGAFVARSCKRLPWLHLRLNRHVINKAINKMQPRPYRLTTMADYTSWESVTDRTHSAREMPPRDVDVALPEASEVADLFRRDAYTASKKSTVFFAYVAQWFTDGFLRSRRFDEHGNELAERSILTNDSTHHVDLAQVYGLTRADTDMLRDKQRPWRMAMEQINGEDYPPALCDAAGNVRAEFAGLRTIGLRDDRVDKSQLRAMGSDAANTQIGYALVNTLFLRAHNAIAEQIRESVDYKDDHARVFAAARNTLTVLTIKLVIEQYINHITPWRFQFKFDTEGFDTQPWQRQNWVAVEFNLLYRWHCMIPPKLEIGGKRLDLTETFFRATRLFTDHGLGALIDDASLQFAGAIELLNTEETLRKRIEEPTIKAARAAKLRSYNDYREHCKLPRVASFEELSSDEEVVRRLTKVYGDIEALEFYPGLFAEDRVTNAVVPPMMGRLVAIHAFSQLLTNPLLARAMFDDEATFSKRGRQIVDEVETLGDVIDLIGTDIRGGREIALTHRDWTP